MCGIEAGNQYLLPDTHTHTRARHSSRQPACIYGTEPTNGTLAHCYVGYYRVNQIDVFFLSCCWVCVCVVQHAEGKSLMCHVLFIHITRERERKKRRRVVFVC